MAVLRSRRGGRRHGGRRRWATTAAATTTATTTAAALGQELTRRRVGVRARLAVVPAFLADAVLPLLPLLTGLLLRLLRRHEHPLVEGREVGRRQRHDRQAGGPSSHERLPGR